MVNSTKFRLSKSISAYLEKIREQRGWCFLPEESLATVKSKTVNFDGTYIIRETPYYLEHRNNLIVVHFLKGSTGFENYYLEDLKDFISEDQEWLCACAGSYVYKPFYVHRKSIEEIIEWSNYFNFKC